MNDYYKMYDNYFDMLVYLVRFALFILFSFVHFAYIYVIFQKMSFCVVFCLTTAIEVC